MSINTVHVQEYRCQNCCIYCLKMGMCIKVVTENHLRQFVSNGYCPLQFQTYQCVYYKGGIATAFWFVYQRLIIIQHIYVSHARVLLLHEILHGLTGKRDKSNLSTESQPWVKGGKGPACVTYECTHSYLKYLQQAKKAPKFEESYLCTLEHHFPLCFIQSWSVGTAGICIGSSFLVCPHVLEKRGNFGKRWIFQNKNPFCSLCRVAFRKWQTSWICSELDDSTRQDQTLSSQEWHFSEWKR